VEADEMKKRILACLLFCTILIASQYNSLMAYSYLGVFEYYRRDNVNYQSNSFLVRAINHAQESEWNSVSQFIIDRYSPKGANVIKNRFERCASFPSGEILLEFITLEIHDNQLNDYLNVIYLKKISHDQYQQVGVFRRRIP
jgi:hypothetical protein